MPPSQPIGDLPPFPDDLVLEPAPVRGWLAHDVEEELPGLELLHWTAEGTEWRRRAPSSTRDWMARLSTRVDGPTVLNAHREDAPAAHRELLRRIGRDPNEDRAPQEAAYHDRIKHGGFPVRGTPKDILLLVLLETGVPIWALDADRITGDLGIRRSLLGELEAGEPQPRSRGPVGRMLGRPDPAAAAAERPPRRPEPVVVDAEGVVAELCREPREPFCATRRTTRTTFFCARVPGLPDLRVEEAIWMCRSLVAREDAA
ncbi:hypothetical protein [Patulibacter sp.]|uniref:hypothetical protein n=1 Tax=Patulibacter sp. TaxID=1912859 RepID=UPI00271E6CA6|nr:hypothetical protein [Patulibacter sp.]MDO9409321.1 hypothetical protein [Patulibacter sp.]